VTSPLDDIAKRLEHLERRMARMEAMSGLGRPTSDKTPQQGVQPRPPTSPPGGALDTLSEVRVDPPASTPITTPQSPSEPSAKTPPPTLRLAPIPPKEISLDFPDLSLLDEKVETRKGPAQKLSVTSAIEEYPRICTRIQQLWGTTECEPYLNTLVIDTRGNRKGFPPAMMEELLYLGRLARALVILNIGGDLWDAYDQIGDRR
jgi:hypothetical protein